LQQLALSERQFYREQHRAIQAFSQLLWDYLKTVKPQDDVISVKSEMQRLSRQSSYETIDVEAFFTGAIATAMSLAEHRQVTIHLSLLQEAGDFTTHQAVLRQTVIWMLSQMITQLAAGADVTLSVSTVNHNLTINFEISGADIETPILHERLTNNPTIAEFLTTLGGTITITETSGSRILVQLQLQRQRQVILVIDDNPDVVALLERYITGMPYEIVSAHDADEGFRVLQSLEPSWIVLDIMLPHTDGWKMLQTLKSNPRTQSVPVLICSVLENPDLAFSLGADAYLRKPPDRISFLKVVGEWTASEH
jgi:CheY-like chemotaxis protein